MEKLSHFDAPPQTALRIHDTFTADADTVLFPGDVRNLLATVPDCSINLIVSSPPYNIGKGYEDRRSIRHYLDGQSQIIRELYRVLSDDGSICWQVGNYVDRGEIIPLDVLFYPIFRDLGMKLRNRIVWHFEHGLHASQRFSGRYETVLWFTKTDDYVFNLDAVRVPSKYPGKTHFKGPKQGQPSGNPLGKNPSDVWSIVADEWEAAFWDIPNVKANHPEKTIHPCQFPVELVERCVLALTNTGDWVLDPYTGVGSSLIAARKWGRRAMGAEQDTQYIALARERLQSLHRGTLKTRPLGKPVHVPTEREKVARVPDTWKTQRSLLNVDDQP